MYKKRITKTKIAPNKPIKEQPEEKKEEIELLKYEIDVDQILLHQRNVFLTGEINEAKAHSINQKLLALSIIDKRPIAMWINSRGGSISDGFAIIDMMRGLSCPVFTFINGSAFSMGALISIAGHRRIITINSKWMIHDGFGGICDYFKKWKDRANHMKDLDRKITRHVKKYTNLTDEEIEYAKKGELWLKPTQCKKKGVVDLIARV